MHALFTGSEIRKSFDTVNLQRGRHLTAMSLQIHPGVDSGILLIIHPLVMSIPCPSTKQHSVRWIVGNLTCLCEVQALISHESDKRWTYDELE